MNRSDLKRNSMMLHGSMSKHGYLRFWHSFSGVCQSTGQTRSFFIEYLIMNPGLGGDQPIFGQHPYYKKRGIKPSYIMIHAGIFPQKASEFSSALPSSEERHLCNYYPVSEMLLAQNPVHLQIGDCLYSEDRIYGYVEADRRESRQRFLMTDEGSMQWDLQVHKSLSCHTGILGSPLFTALNVLDSFWHGEGIRTAYSGTVIFDGLTYEVSPESSNGYADKHWGRKYNNPWLQFSSCCLMSKRTGKALKYSAFAIDGCCPRFLWFHLKPRLTMQLTYTGEDYCFSLAQLGRLSRSKWSSKETNKRYIWHIKAQDKKSFVKVSLSCLKDEMMELERETPDGVLLKESLVTGAYGVGTIDLYRLTPEGRQWIDTLTVENGFCTCKQ